jgi:uncharacterized protein GlcG (DUF336 family)
LALWSVLTLFTNCLEVAFSETQRIEGHKKGWGLASRGFGPFLSEAAVTSRSLGGVAGFTLWHPYHRWFLVTLREREDMETITLEEARRVIDAAEHKAQEIDCPMDIAVVDAGGNLKTHVRMDGAFIGSITISINKAYTAIAFQGETKDLVDQTQPGGPIFGLSDAHGGNLVIFPGGIPLRRDGDIVGAIGVSTGTVEQDQEVAEAGAAAF